MPSSTPPRAVQVTPLQLVFMNHEAPPSIAIDIQSWVRFGSGQLAKAQSERAAHQAQWEGSILDADPPVQGVKIARRITYETTSCAVSWRKASGV
jgi:hypothetical protein